MFPDQATGGVLTVRFVGGGDLQAATSGYRVRILGGLIVAEAGGATFRFQSGGTTNLFGGSIVLAANATLVLPATGTGWEETAVGEKLNLAVPAGNIHGALRIQLVK